MQQGGGERVVEGDVISMLLRLLLLFAVNAVHAANFVVVVVVGHMGTAAAMCIRGRCEKWNAIVEKEEGGKEGGGTGTRCIHTQRGTKDMCMTDRVPLSLM